MNCLNEYQLECLIKNSVPIKGILWRRHLQNCSICQQKLEELKNNLLIEQDILQTLKISRDQ